MKPEIRITLFGKFSVHVGPQILLDPSPHKVQELLAYLLLHRSRAHPREALAELLWEEADSQHSRKYLRQALWQLHAGLLALGRARASSLIHQESEWVELGLDQGVWVDTVAFEGAFNSTRGRALVSAADARRLMEAVHLYRGDLLEGQYPSWCVYERDRFRQMYLTILDKLVGFCQENGQYEAGMAYGTLALRCDPARERTHRNLMALLCLSGDRTGALRQYERCVAALREELDVEPDQQTVALYEKIRAGAATPAGEVYPKLTPLEPPAATSNGGRSKEPRRLVKAAADPRRTEL